MVVTVEPGIYLPGVGGVRLEDDVVVLAGGCRRLTRLPRRMQAFILRQGPSAGRRRPRKRKTP
jgi:Xaa-Pro aminopeptidase